MFKSLLVTTLFFVIGHNQNALAQAFGKSLQSARLEKSGTNLVLKVKPNTAHHYNLDAPTKVLKSGQDVKPSTLTPTLLEVNVSSEGKCDYQIQTYVCDDKKTFCAPQNMSVSCEDIKKLSTKPEFTTKGSITVSAAEINGPSEGAIGVAKSESAHKKELFITNDPKMALEMARTSGKPLFIDFFGTWCPPCNILDETVFNTPLFAGKAKNMVLLKLDADHKVSWELKSKYAVTGYPTVVLATSTGEEITRFLGSLPEKQIVKLMDYAVKNKSTSLAQKMEDYKSKPNSKLASEIIDALVVTENYEATLPYISQAIQDTHVTLTQKELALLLPLLAESKANKGQLSKTQMPLLKSLLEQFPVSDFYYQKLDLMTNTADTLKDEELKKWVHETNIKKVDTALAKKNLDLNLITRLDLLYYKADSFEKLGQTDNEKKAHAEIAKEYASLIAKYKQNPATNRGYNLERIYSVYKSGAVKEARAEYEKIIDIYPREFTFHYNYASVLKDLKDWDEALKYAQNALTYSYGDNQLRAIYLVSEIEANKGLKKEPLERISKAIQSTELPKDEAVRTHRYIKRLADLKKKIEN